MKLEVGLFEDGFVPVKSMLKMEFAGSLDAGDTVSRLAATVQLAKELMPLTVRFPHSG